MLPPPSVLLLVSIDDERVRGRMLRYLQEADAQLSARQVQRRELPSLDQAAGHVQRWYAEPGARGVILLSDGLVDARLRAPTSAAKDLFDQFSERLYSTVAVMARPERMLDVDRSVARECGPQELLRAVNLCLDRLAYLQPPERRTLPNEVRIRRIQTDTELLKYFRLRHDVYTPMSYLETLVEQAPSRMDVDWFDTRSVHVGAFEQTATHERLVGTARLITTELIDQDHADMARELARRDPVLERFVNEGAVPLLLPVVQSQNALIEHLQRAWESEERLILGELSRVVVHLDYRGAGLSLLLSQHAVGLAREAGLAEVFLECLPIHEKIYHRAGFETLPLRGQVYSVNKTMAVMYQRLSQEPIAAGSGHDLGTTRSGS